MSQGLINSETLDGIASAIQAKTGSSTPLAPSAMATAISNIPSGGGGDEKLSIPLTLFSPGATTTDIDNAFKFSDGKYLDINEYFSNRRHITKTATAPSAQTITTDVVYSHPFVDFCLKYNNNAFSIKCGDNTIALSDGIKHFFVEDIYFFYYYEYNNSKRIKGVNILSGATIFSETAATSLTESFYTIKSGSTTPSVFPGYGKQIGKSNGNSSGSIVYVTRYGKGVFYTHTSGITGSDFLNGCSYSLNTDGVNVLASNTTMLGLTTNESKTKYALYQKTSSSAISVTDVTNNTTLHYPLDFGAGINFGNGVTRYFDFEGDYYDRAVTIV